MALTRRRARQDRRVDAAVVRALGGLAKGAPVTLKENGSDDSQIAV